MIRAKDSLSEVLLSRRPVRTITSVTEDGTLLTEGADYLTNKATGCLERLSGEELSIWSFSKLTVAYDAGWQVPSSASRDLPYEIEEATIYTVSSRLNELSPNGDREISNESLDGVYSASYETTGAHRFEKHQGLPQRAVALLAKYRVPMV